jgi:hypothetical protein
MCLASNKPRVGDYTYNICLTTGKMVKMIYQGPSFVSENGHPGWMCIHEDGE